MTFHRMSRMFITFLIVTVLSGCGGKADRMAKHFAKGKAFFAQHEYEKARVEFQNVLQIDPKNHDARFDLAQTLEKLNNIRLAAGMYMAINQADANRIDSRISLARLFMLGRNVDQAEILLKQVQAIDAGNISAMALQAGIKFLRKDLAGAKEDAEGVLKRDEKNLESLFLLASIAQQEKDFAKAETLLQTAVKIYPEHSSPGIMLVAVYLQQERFEDAIKTLQGVIAQEPKNMLLRVQLANIYLRNNQKNQAEQVLVKAVNEQPSTDAKMLHVRFLLDQGTKEQAVKQLQAYVDAAPGDYDLRLAQGRFFETLEDKAKAQQVYAEIAKADRSGPNGLIAQTNEARILVLDKKVEQAESKLNSVLKENPHHFEALILKGDIALSLNRPSEAITHYRSAIKEQPDSADVLKSLSRAHMAGNEPELALDSIQKAVELKPVDTTARYQWAEMARQQSKLDIAEEQFNKILKIDPKHSGALEGLFKLAIAKKDLQSADGIADSMIRLYPERGEGYYLKGAVAHERKDFTAAVAQYKRSLEKQDHALLSLTGLVKAELARNNTEDAKAFLQGLLTKEPKDVVVMNLLAETFIFEKNLPQAQRVLLQAIAINPKHAVLYRNLAGIHLAMKNNAQAIAVLDEGIKAIGGSNSLVFYKAQFLENQGDIDAAIKVYESALKDDPNAYAAINNLAMLLVMHKKDDSAGMAKAKQLAESMKHINNPAFLDTVGWVYYQTGDYGNAVVYLEKAVNAAPDAAELRYHYGMAANKQGHTAIAKEQLQKAVDSPQRFRDKDAAREALAALPDKP